MTESFEVPVSGGGVIRAYDTGGEGPTVMWFHGSPQTGRPLSPVVEAARARGMRVLSYARPSYGGSSALPGRDVASAAPHAAAVADAAGVARFVTMGASGGGPHALACAAMLPERITAVVGFASLAPFSGTTDWWDGMAAPEALRAALHGRAARALFAETDEFDPASFNDRDYAALDGSWSALGADVAASAEWGDDGLIDDDVAFAGPWGFDVGAITAPVLLAHGSDDRVVPAHHADLLAGELDTCEQWRREGDGHISILETIDVAVDWTLRHAR